MTSAIHYNHLGYASDAPKKILVTDCAESVISLLDERRHLVATLPLLPNGTWEYTNEAVKVGDFSSLTKAGTYRLSVGSLVSEEFPIGRDWISEQLRSAVKGYFYQRSGVELEASKAGKWARPASQKDEHLLFHPSMDRGGEWNGHGGWFDAGDYGKYIVNGGYALSVLMFAEELFEDKLTETGLLDEIRFEAEWFLRMQDADGGVFFKVSPDRWDTFVCPKDASESRKIVGKSTSSALNFAAALAQAHRVFSSSDLPFATACLDAAQRAYDWALRNPKIPAPPHTEGSGPYGDANLDDDFFWARAMLYRESDRSEFLTQLEADVERENVTEFSDWSCTQNLAFFALALQGKNGRLQKRCREKLQFTANRVVEHLEASAYRVPMERFMWGSNGMVLSSAMLALVVNSWGKDAKYENLSHEVLDYVYGRNPVNTAFVTGSAWSSPKFPHHRISGGDNVEDPVPGLLVGGINFDHQDDILKNPRGISYPRTERGFSYVDLQRAFACNEVAINWNAPLVFVLAALK